MRIGVIFGVVSSLLTGGLALGACGGGSTSMDPPCVLATTQAGQICGKGLVCGSADGSLNLQCIPVACEVLSDCCAFVENEEAAGVSGNDTSTCKTALATKDGATCDAELAAIRAEGHCGTKKGIGGALMCEQSGIGCTPTSAAIPGRASAGTCCDGLICDEAAGGSGLTCLPCTPAGGTPPDERCCGDSLYNSSTSTCDPLRDDGASCSGNVVCWSDLCIDGLCSGARSNGEPCTAANQCVNGVCASGTCAGGGGSTSSSSSGGGPEACEGSWCNGCTGGGGAYCCSACTTSTMCESQCTGTDDF